MRRAPVAVLAVAIALIVFGQAVAYYVPHSSPEIKTVVEGDTITYTVDSKKPMQCTELHLTDSLEIREFYLFYDDGYSVASGSMSIPSAYYFLKKNFDLYSGIELEIKDAQEVKGLIDSGRHDFGLIFISGALPDTIYDGTLSSPVIQWIQAGGYVIWSGDLFGRYVSTTDGLTEVGDYRTSVAEPLFGTGCRYNDAEDDTFGDERVNGGLTDAAGMYYANTQYGWDCSSVAVPHIEVGYTDGDYSSIVVMGIGSGTLCHFGDYAAAQESGYLAHVATLGLTSISDVDAYTTSGAPYRGHTASFEDSPGVRHLVILHDIRWCKVWSYDRSDERFE